MDGGAGSRMISAPRICELDFQRSGVIGFDGVLKGLARSERGDAESGAGIVNNDIGDFLCAAVDHIDFDDMRSAANDHKCNEQRSQNPCGFHFFSMTRAVSRTSTEL